MSRGYYRGKVPDLDDPAFLEGAQRLMDEMFPKPTSREIMKQQGFTGNACAVCGSLRMQVAGHCEVCTECGTTTGCS